MSYIACENHSIGFGRVIFVYYDFERRLSHGTNS